MSDKSGIEWTDATWNPVSGCEKVSPGCDHCYAETFAERWRGVPGHHFERGFDVQLRPGKLDQPLRWGKPRRIFVNSMSDLFHKDVPDDYIARVFAVMALAPHHIFQVLTKRHGRMRSLLSAPDFQGFVCGTATSIASGYRDDGLAGGNPLNLGRWPLPNVWVGVSVEDQQWADVRVPALLDTPAAVRFISAEPLLGPVDLLGPVVNGHRPRLTYWLDGRPGWGPERREPTGPITQELLIGPAVDWLIAGGESGPGARRCDIEWLRSLKDQCAGAGVPVFVKQLGSVLGRELDAGPKGGNWGTWPADLRVREFPRAMKTEGAGS